MPNSSYFRRQIALPQDHGSWVFLLSPLLIGLFTGGQFSAASAALIVAALAAFLIRQPLTILIKVYSKRRSDRDRPVALFWSVVYASIGLIAMLVLIWLGYSEILILAVPGIPVFSWHLYLVSRRQERRKIGVEVIACGVLSLAAPAAYWIGKEEILRLGWWLFILTWLQSAASIVYAYLRLQQRELTSIPSLKDRFRLGFRAILYTSFNLILVISFSLPGILPAMLFIPYLLQWGESLWGITHPAIGWKPTRIGIRQLIVSTLFTLFFILAWNYS